jgi:hypothetical protein
MTMNQSTEAVSACALIGAPVAEVFAVLADPGSHAEIDGTGWVREPRDGQRLTVAGQVFRMAMHHDNHPDGHYEMANEVRVFDPPRAISWAPGQDLAGDGTLRFDGWIWRYDLTPAGGSTTEVTLSYDWSAVPAALRDHIAFPPFGPDHLGNSLAHLAGIVTARSASLDALPGIGAPATRALRGAGYSSLRRLADVRRSELAGLHGVGPRALTILERAMADHGLQLR